MYQFDSTKQYYVKVTHPDGSTLIPCALFRNAKLIEVAPNFVALQDNNGKEHIYTGSLCIEIREE